MMKFFNDHVAVNSIRFESYEVHFLWVTSGFVYDFLQSNLALEGPAKMGAITLYA